MNIKILYFIIPFLFQNYLYSQNNQVNVDINIDSVLNVRKIWDFAKHNAFTDIIRFNDIWYISFREATGHNSYDGKIRVINSIDGNFWKSVCLIEADSSYELRDGKFFIFQDKLFLYSRARKNLGNQFIAKNLFWVSNDGINYSSEQTFGDNNYWIWRMYSLDSNIIGIGYRSQVPANDRYLRIFGFNTMSKYSIIKDSLLQGTDPTEATSVFTNRYNYIFSRRQSLNFSIGKTDTAFTNFNWFDGPIMMGGPNAIKINDSLIVIAGRLHLPSHKTGLLTCNINNDSINQSLILPSGGDNSYPGLYIHNDTLWISYYSSHEGNTNIYLAKIPLSFFNGFITKVESEFTTINDETMNLYPNPFHKQFEIKYNLDPTDSDRIFIKITDILGREIKQIQDVPVGADLSSVIDMSHVSSGIYLVNIIQGSEIKTFKIIKY